jgi:hypothetical protein
MAVAVRMRKLTSLCQFHKTKAVVADVMVEAIMAAITVEIRLATKTAISQVGETHSHARLTDLATEIPVDALRRMTKSSHD